MRSIIFLIILSSQVLIVSANTDNSTSEYLNQWSQSSGNNDLYNSGKKALQNQDYESAIIIFNELLKKNEINTFEVRIQLAFAYQKLHYDQLAIQAYSDAINDYRDSDVNSLSNLFVAQSNLVSLYLNQENYIEASRYLKECVRLKPDQIGYLKLYAQVSLKLGDVEESILSFEKLLEKDPTEKKYIQILNQLFEEEKNKTHKIALSDNESKSFSSPSLDKQKAKEYRYLGQNLESKNKFEEAYFYYQRSFSLDNDNIEIYWKIYQLTSLIHGDLEALEFLKKAQIKYPHEVGFALELGKLSFKLKQYSNAIQYFDWVRKMNPESNEKIYFFLGICYEFKNGIRYQEGFDFQKSISCYQMALKINPQFIEAYINLGQLYTILKEYSSAYESFQKAIQLNPDSSKLFYFMGYVLQKNNQLEKAVSSYQQSVKLDPSNLQSWFNLGVSYQKMGLYKLSVESFQRVIDLDSTAADAVLNLALIYDNEFQNAFFAKKYYEIFLKIGKKSEDLELVKQRLQEL